MKKTTFATLAALSAIALGVHAEIVPGVWNDDFTASKAYADETGIPLVVIWGNQSCGYCNNLAEAIELEPMTTWASAHPVILCHKHDPYQAVKSKYSDDYLAANEWILSQNINTLTGYPRVGVYWAKNIAGMEVSYAFSGRIGDMPVTTPRGTSNTVLSKQFANSLDMLIGDYEPKYHGEFAIGDTDTDHLEANGTVASVSVPFTRAMASKAAVETLVVSYPAVLSRADETLTLNWAVGVDALSVAVPVYWMDVAVGQVATLAYRDSDGNLIATSHIRYVKERPCSVAYPRFIGEDFAYGEWTMDYAAAKARAVQDCGYVLVLFTGTMWCPYCYGLDTVFKDERFVAWARDNKVSLVTFDQGLASSPSTAEGTLQARLLSYTAGTDHYKEGQDPAGAGVLRSGAYYMSGKGITFKAAASARALTTKYTEQFLSPESTSARCGNPTLLLVKNDKVVGRVATLRNGYVYNADETIARLPDLLALNSRNNEYDDYASTTTLSVGLGTDVGMELQISRRAAFVKFDCEKAGRYCFTATNSTSAEPVVVSVYVGGTTLLASGTGEVSTSISASSLLKGVIVKVSSYADASRTICTGGNTSRMVVRLSVVSESGSVDEDGPGFDPDGNPCFGWENYEFTVWKGFAISKSFNLVNIDDATSVTLKSAAGTLPKGIKFNYNRLTQRAELTGSPSKIGSFFSNWRVATRIGRSTKIGAASAFAITVSDPSVINPNLGKSRTATIPLLTDSGYFAGTLTVVISSKNVITARYAGTEAKSLTFSGSWCDLDAASENVTATLTNNGAKLELEMDAEGKLSVVFVAPATYSYFAEGLSVILTGSSAPLATDELSDYKGYYTVTLPMKDVEADVSGTGYLTLKMTTASAVRKGTVSYAGVMPNGTAISGSATLSQASEAGCAILPVFVRKGKDVFASLLQIKANAADTWGESGSDKVQTISGASIPYQLHRETTQTYMVEAEVYGGYYKTGSSPLFLAELHGLESEMDLTIDGVETATLTATARGFTSENVSGRSFSFVKSTGVFSGRATVHNALGRSVLGTFKGVLMPGWTGCGACGEGTVVRPFGSGTLFYTDKIDGKKVISSVPIDIVAVEKP